jgi:O-antigen/teichoic acid export membrane protein
VVTIGLGGVAVLIAGLAGPWLLRTAFGPEYTAGGALLAWLTTAAIVIALLTLTGAATVAASRHRAYATGWVGATLASGLLLLLPLDLETRTVVALTCGPLVGIAVHVVALSRVPRV